MIATSFTAKLIVGDSTLPVATSLFYSPEDPYAVIAKFEAEGEVTEWTFDRGLLDAGLTGEAGLGDVRVWLDELTDDILLRLTSPEGSALIQLPYKAIKGFLDRTYNAVPQGREVFDVDALVAHLLSD